MELKLCGSNSVSASGLAHNGRTCSSFRHAVGVRFSPHLSSCRGTSSSVSNNTYLSKRAIASGDQESVVEEDYVYRITGTNGASSSLFSRNIRLLDFFDDQYEGVVVDPDRLPANPNVFASMIRLSLNHWRRMQKKGVWLKLPVAHAELVPVAIKEGFQYHHAEQGYVMLTYWIPDGPSMLPGNATHHVGVGGFVINDNDEVLVVQEKYCNPSSTGLWKLPTGFILESEEIYKGAIREVKEETGIDSEFVEVVAFRHAHEVVFNKSDLFFVCILKPVSSQIRVDDLEIQAAKWMPLMEFVEQPLIQGDCMFKKIIDICIARLGNRYCGLHPHQVVSAFDCQISSLYYNVHDTQDVNCTTGN